MTKTASTYAHWRLLLLNANENIMVIKNDVRHQPQHQRTASPTVLLTILPTVGEVDPEIPETSWQIEAYFDGDRKSQRPDLFALEWL